MFRQKKLYTKDATSLSTIYSVKTIVVANDTVTIPKMRLLPIRPFFFSLFFFFPSSMKYVATSLVSQNHLSHQEKVKTGILNLLRDCRGRRPMSKIPLTASRSRSLRETSIHERDASIQFFLPIPIKGNCTQVSERNSSGELIIPCITFFLTLLIDSEWALLDWLCLPLLW